MPDFTEAQRERLAEALWRAEKDTQPHSIAYADTYDGEPTEYRRIVRAQVDALALVVAAIADEAAAEALDQRNEALDRLSDRTRAKWEAEDRYAALVDKVRALADVVDKCEGSGLWLSGADLRTLLEADQ